ncbi:MAG: hypothetical protein JSU77_03575 [Fidelibacterota bacterium]|nr:MAG: hypothetical protein JSU77_03575 [Candidatus Neomarinimicrobiota bacterium]
MMSVGESVAIEFKYSSFNVRGFTLTQISLPKDEQIPVGFHLELEFSLDDEKQILICRLSTVIQIGEGDEVQKCVELDTESAYNVRGWENLQKEGKTYQLPDDLLVTLFSIHYSTTRGVLIEKTSGTPFSRFILPIMNVKEILFNSDGKPRYQVRE